MLDLHFADGSTRSVSPGDRLRSAAFGDINKDGLDDVVTYGIVGEGISERGVLKARNQFGRDIEFFGINREFTNAGDGKVALGDLNADGFDEVVLGLGSIRVYSREGTTIEFPSTDFPADSDLAVGDINGDGFDDVIIGRPGAQYLIILTHPAATGVIPSAPAQFDKYDDLDVGDLNADGLAEIVIGHASLSADTSARGNLEILNFGSIPAPIELRAPSFDFRRNDELAVGDLDGDGFAEVLVSNHDFLGTDPDRIRTYSRPDGPPIQRKFPTMSWNLKFAIGQKVTNAEQDTDGDGILDVWETLGIDSDGDGVIDLDLPGLGANPNHKDIFVEIDAMVCGVAGGDCAPGDTHGHLPTTPDLARAVAAFANAPVGNPDGTQGIDLRLVFDDSVPHQLQCEFDGCFEGVKGAFFGTAAERGKPNFAAIRRAKSAVFHYSLWVHDLREPQSDVGGLGEAPGNDFIVGRFFFENGIEQSTSFMHELGHNLGLQHGGADEVNHKPNYLSVMNYSFGALGIPPMNTVDYSRQRLPDLDERSLDEALGIQGPATLETIFSCPDGLFGPSTPANLTIDWDCDGVRAIVAANINNDGVCIKSGANTILNSSPGGDDLRHQGTIEPGPNGFLDSLIVAFGMQGDDVLLGTLEGGADGAVQTLPLADDVALRRIHPGPDNNLDSVVDPRDIVTTISIFPGADGILDSARLLDDAIEGGLIQPGPDGVLNSFAALTDVATGTNIGPGVDGTLESVRRNDDTIVGGVVRPGRNGAVDTVAAAVDLLSQSIFPGVDQTLESTPALDDVNLVFQIIPGPNGSLDTREPLAQDDFVVASTITGGANDALETQTGGDDIELTRIDPDLGGIMDSVLRGDDVAQPGIHPGGNNMLDTPIVGDDLVVGNMIQPGANGVLDSAPASPQDVLTSQIFAGPNLRLDTVPSPLDVSVRFQLLPGLNGRIDSDTTCNGLTPDDVPVGTTITFGTNGRLETAACRDDLVVGQSLADGPNRTCESAARPDDDVERGTGSIQPAILSGHDDWQRLLYNFRGSSDFAEGVHATVPREPRRKEVQLLVERLVSATDLSIAVQASATTVSAGGSATFTALLTNLGPRVALTPTISGLLGNGLSLVDCKSSSLALAGCESFGTSFGASSPRLEPGATVQVELVVNAQCTSPFGQDTEVNFLATAAAPDSNPSNNAASSLIRVLPTAPTLVAPPDVKLETCDASSPTVQLGYAAVQDACDPNPALAIVLESINGKPTNTPIMPTDVLPLGISIVRYEATNAAGLSTVARQTVAVSRALSCDVLHSERGLTIGNNVRLTSPGGAFASAADGKLAGQNALGVGSEVSSLFLGSSITLRNKAHVHGAVYATPAALVDLQVHARIDQGVQRREDLFLADISQCTVRFPTLQGNIDLPPKATLSLTPGAHGDVRLKPNATLTLVPGTYYFEGLELEPNSLIDLAGQGQFVVFVKSRLAIKGAFGAQALSSLLIVYAGNQMAFLETTFAGTVLAPYGGLTLGSGKNTFSGGFYANSIEIRPNAAVIHVPRHYDTRATGLICPFPI